MDPTPPYNIFDLFPKDMYAMHMQFRYGFGQKTVLLHGLGSSGRYYSETAKYLFDQYQVISFDLLGFGQSPQPSPYGYYLWQQADALRQAMWNEHLWGKLNIVGHSLGALVALEFAKRYPKKVNKLILCNIPLILNRKQALTIRERYRDMANGIHNELHRQSLKTIRKSKVVQNKLMPHYVRRKKGEGVFKSYDLEHISRYAYLRSIEHSIESNDGLNGLDNLAVKTFVIATRRDKAVIKNNIQKLISTLPNAQLIELDGNHQFPILEPQKFAQTLRGCLKQ